MLRSAFVILLLFITERANGIPTSQAECEIEKTFRGRFKVMEERNSEIIVRRNSIVFYKNRVEKDFKCIDKGSFSTYLLESKDGAEVICLSFAIMADTNYEFTVRRMSASQNSGFFETQTRVPDASVKNTCVNYEGPEVRLQRISPGCQFPVLLRKQWNYEGDLKIRGMTVNVNTMSLTYKNGNILVFTCERIDNEGQGYNIAMRTSSITAKNDGVLCLNVSPDRSKYRTEMNIKVSNSAGDSAYDLVKLISRYEPIYLHQTCDLIDAPTDAGRLN